MICQYCHRDLVSLTAYEDGLYQTIGAWLCEKTCIPWYKMHGSIKVDEEQYGMVFIRDYQPKHQDEVLRQAGADLDNAEFCYQVSETVDFIVDLHVINEQGDPIHLGQAAQDPGAWKRSASDVLHQVNNLIQIDEHVKPLNEAGLRFTRTQLIEANIDMIDKAWVNMFEASFNVTSCRLTSYPVDGAELVYCVELCDGTPICRAKEHPDCPV